MSAGNVHSLIVSADWADSVREEIKTDRHSRRAERPIFSLCPDCDRVSECVHGSQCWCGFLCALNTTAWITLAPWPTFDSSDTKIWAIVPVRPESLPGEGTETEASLLPGAFRPTVLRSSRWEIIDGRLSGGFPNLTHSLQLHFMTERRNGQPATAFPINIIQFRRRKSCIHCKIAISF